MYTNIGENRFGSFFMKCQIFNVVATTDLGVTLNLNTFVESFTNCEYEPEIYFALIYRLKKPKISILINKSGKIIFNGSSDMDDIYYAREKLFSDLKLIGYHPIDNAIKIQNIGILVDLGKKVKLSDRPNYDQSDFIITLKENKTIIKNARPKFTSVIYTSGKCLIMGLNDFTQINQMLKLLAEWIDSYFYDTE